MRSWPDEVAGSSSTTSRRFATGPTRDRLVRHAVRRGRRRRAYGISIIERRAAPRAATPREFGRRARARFHPRSTGRAPFPSPTGFVVKNGLKMRESARGASPGPYRRPRRRAARRVVRVDTSMRALPSTSTSACSAFVSRLSTTCCSWNGSAHVSGSSGSRLTSMLDLRAAHRVAAQLERVVDDAIEIGDACAPADADART